jgi:nitroreductase
MSTIVPEMEKRRAYRAMDERPVPEDVQKRLLEAAVLAPSCSNKQPWRFVVVDREPALSAVRDAIPGGNYWAKKAPLYIALVTDNSFDCDMEDRRHYALFDLGMAAMNLQLQAVREGLYVHPIAGFKDVQLKKALSIPEEHVLITVINLAWPGSSDHLSDKHKEQESAARERKPMNQVVSRNGWHFDE